MMRVLVADKLPERFLDEIRSLGVEVSYQPELATEQLPAALADTNVLIVRGRPVTDEAINVARSLNLIVRAGAGVRNIDVAAASARGVYVANCPGRNASAVAELTMTLIGSLDRRVPDAVASLRSGKWEKDEYARAVGLRGKTLGILGLGHIGRYVLRLAQAYGMNTLAWSRSLTLSRAAELGVTAVRNPEELARQSEIFSVHLELTDRTRGMVNRKLLEALPDGAFFVNTARSELVDHEALLELIPKKNLRVALDVLPDEPEVRSASYDHPLLHAGTSYATPHIGASTDEAQESIASETVRIVRSFLSKGEVPNVVNISATTRARYQLVVRHRDKVGALANVLGVLKRHGINIQEVSNAVFEGGRAGCAKIQLDTRPSEGCLTEIMAYDDEVLHVDLVSLPNLA